MTPIVFVCHDTGNTNVLLTAAKSMLQNNADLEIKFLVIGEAANNIFNNKANAHLKEKVIRLTDWIEEKDFSKLNLRPLTTKETEIVAANLVALNPLSAITGCSCGPQALAPFQVGEILSKIPTIEANIIYNGDFFQDLKNNPFWACLTTDWIEKLSVYVAFVEAMNQVEAFNKSVKRTLAGSSALDNVLEAKEDLNYIASVRTALGVADNQNLVFVSGSKFINDDLKLLEALAESLQNNPEAAVRMGMHPGTSDVPDYVGKLVAWLDKMKIENLRLVVKPAVAAKIPADLLGSTITADLSGDEIFPAISAVASSQPSTIPTQAIMRQLPSFCLEEYKPLSYLHAFFAKSSENLFAAPSQKTELDKTKLGLPAQRTVEIIEEGLTAPLVSHKLR
jgi:hypothetical protein